MRISDWSSDVCSSDLGGLDQAPAVQRPYAIHATRQMQIVRHHDEAGVEFLIELDHLIEHAFGSPGIEIAGRLVGKHARSEEHTSELQSLMRISYAVFCLKKKNNTTEESTLLNNKYMNT